MRWLLFDDPYANPHQVNRQLTICLVLLSLLLLVTLHKALAYRTELRFIIQSCQ